GTGLSIRWLRVRVPSPSLDTQGFTATPSCLWPRGSENCQRSFPGRLLLTEEIADLLARLYAGGSAHASLPETFLPPFPWPLVRPARRQTNQPRRRPQERVRPVPRAHGRPLGWPPRR